MDMSRADIFALEADIAFFEARLSFADGAPDTAYQRAQIKTYQTLESLFSDTLAQTRPQIGKRPPSQPSA